MKTPVIEPYLFVGGRCEEAVEFYESALAAKRVMLMRFEEAPGQPPEGMLAPGWEEKRRSCTAIFTAEGLHETRRLELHGGDDLDRDVDALKRVQAGVDLGHCPAAEVARQLEGAEPHAVHRFVRHPSTPNPSYRTQILMSRRVPYDRSLRGSVRGSSEMV